MRKIPPSTGVAQWSPAAADQAPSHLDDEIRRRRSPVLGYRASPREWTTTAPLVHRNLKLF